MRRTTSPVPLVLLGIGTFLLVLAAMLAWYVEPRAQRTPIDTDATTVFTGQGSYFDAKKVKTVDGTKLTITRKVRGDVADSEAGGRAIWDVSTSVDTDDTLPASDPHDAFQWTVERWVTDRKTNAPVHCCGESPRFEGEAYLKFPFGVERRSYRWWDSTLGATVELRFKDRTKIQGHEGYLFTGTVDPVKTGTRQVPGVLVGQPDRGQVLAEEWYANHGIELVADQRTGRILYAAIGPRKTLRAPGAGSGENEVVLLESKRIAFTEETQKKQVELAKADHRKLQLVGLTVPVGAGGLGLLLAVAGSVMVFRGRPEGADAVPASARIPESVPR
ncbi:DUF3068 domain-containing protein [Streptomyces katsurahamanus]|uniref:DUF3068 domain-containing protein n=1 Tax=Streptomyces katsurahamanus TaxID=2577098 RepID=A0ABW9NVN8_9ACTN|nr:DUF3068 domain-containing protein [Streptomyces katsurahamanus]MQS37315.1 DUF3068 domain-containing protein [Streptomyces katsurahamanus]